MMRRKIYTEVTDENREVLASLFGVVNEKATFVCLEVDYGWMDDDGRYFEQTGYTHKPQEDFVKIADTINNINELKQN